MPLVGPSTLQQSCPAPQHMVPQQRPVSQPVFSQGGSMQVPPPQKDLSAGHLLPHSPQFMGSFSVLMQRSPQQVRYSL
jgi:hypothetical protein